MNRRGKKLEELANQSENVRDLGAENADLASQLRKKYEEENANPVGKWVDRVRGKKKEPKKNEIDIEDEKYVQPNEVSELKDEKIELEENDIEPNYEAALDQIFKDLKNRLGEEALDPASEDFLQDAKFHIKFLKDNIRYAHEQIEEDLKAKRKVNPSILAKVFGKNGDESTVNKPMSDETIARLRFANQQVETVELAFDLKYQKSGFSAGAKRFRLNCSIIYHDFMALCHQIFNHQEGVDQHNAATKKAQRELARPEQAREFKQLSSAMFKVHFGKHVPPELISEPKILKKKG